MSLQTSQPNTSNNSNRRSKVTPSTSSSQVGIEGLKQHMNSVVAEVDTPKLTGPTGSIDYKALLEKARIRPSDQIEKPVNCWAIIDGEQSSVVGTMGNISTMTGRAKSKKTFAVTIAVSAAIASKPILERVVGLMDPSNDVVMLFDTEQSHYHVSRVVKRICLLTGIEDPKNLFVYSLRPFEPEERLQVINFAIHNTPGVGLVVIDGVRDLAVDPITDSEQASRIMTHLLRWTDQFNIHILTVLHQNKGDTNLRGHLGTELVNKSESVISISRDTTNKEISIVAPEFCRDKEFTEFGFSVDESGLPFLIDSIQIGTDTDQKGDTKAKHGARKAKNITPDQLTAIVKRAFTDVEFLRFKDLKTNIAEAVSAIVMELSKNEIEGLIQRAKIEGYIDWHDRDKKLSQPYPYYTLPHE